LLEIARIQELKRSVRKPAPPIPLDAKGRQAQWMKAKNELYRDYQKSVRAMPIPQRTPEQLKLQEDLRVAETRYAPVQDAAEVFLRQSFGDERLQTFFLRSRDGELERIPAPRWRTEAGIKAFANGLWMSDPGPSHAIGPVLVREADMEALLLPENGSAPAPADLTDSSGASERPSAPRPSYSPDSLGAWFLLRVGTWPKEEPPPTETQDLEAARVYFDGKIPRDEFRGIRKEKTPKTWRKSGPRGPRQ
jgi:hypothetical protein